jgi:hypothetical protein
MSASRIVCRVLILRYFHKPFPPFDTPIGVTYTIRRCTLFLILLFQVIIETQYSVVILMSCIGISSLFGVGIMILLASRLLSWFRTDKNVTVVLYGISSAIIASNIAFGVVIVIDLLLTKPYMIQPHFGWEYASSGLGPLNDAVFYGYSISSICGFVIAWISTIVLLCQFSVR